MDMSSDACHAFFSSWYEIATFDFLSDLGLEELDKEVGGTGRRGGGVWKVRETCVDLGKQIEVLRVPQRHMCISSGPCVWAAAFPKVNVALVLVVAYNVGLLDI